MSDFDFETPVQTKQKKGLASSSKSVSKATSEGSSVTTEESKDAKGASENLNSSNPAEKDKPEPKPKFSKEELVKVFDDIIFSGEYSEEVTIRGKLHVKFRTRTGDEISEITSKVDSVGDAKLLTTLDEKRQILNLQYALVQFGGDNLSLLDKTEKEKFVGKIPAPLIGSLLNELMKFDIKVSEACKDGEENF